MQPTRAVGSFVKPAVVSAEWVFKWTNGYHINWYFGAFYLLDFYQPLLNFAGVSIKWKHRTFRNSFKQREELLNWKRQHLHLPIAPRLNLHWVKFSSSVNGTSSL